MADPGVARFLELVQRELGAADARIEIGGKDPTDDRVVWHDAANGWRVVALFETPPADRTAIQSRLDGMSDSFFATVDHASIGPPSTRTPPEIAGRRLDDELGRLAEKAGARGAVVFDVASPVVWGASRSSDPDADALLEDTIVKIRDATGELRPGHTARLPVKANVECLARQFAGVYVLALAFQDPLSEPTALGAVLHALPLIERLVLALPPVDPPSGGAKIVRLPGPR